jgi:hypothetical protein
VETKLLPATGLPTTAAGSALINSDGASAVALRDTPHFASNRS